MGDGIAAIRSAMDATESGYLQIEYHEVYRLLAEGSVALSTSGGNGVHSSFYALYRIADGKIAEHRDTVEALHAAGAIDEPKRTVPGSFAHGLCCSAHASIPGGAWGQGLPFSPSSTFLQSSVKACTRSATCTPSPAGTSAPRHPWSGRSAWHHTPSIAASEFRVRAIYIKAGKAARPIVERPRENSAAGVPAPNQNPTGIVRVRLIRMLLSLAEPGQLS